MWLSSEGPEKTDAVRGSSLSAKLHVCDRQLGQFSCQARSCSWQVTFKVDKINYKPSDIAVQLCFNEMFHNSCQQFS